MKKVLLTSAVALAAFGAVQSVSAEEAVASNGDSLVLDVKPAAKVRDKALTKPTKKEVKVDPGVKVDKNETPNSLENSLESNGHFFVGADKEKNDYDKLRSDINNTDNEVTVEDLNTLAEYDTVFKERANHKFEYLTVRDRDGKEFVFHGKKVQVKNQDGTSTLTVKTKSGTYKLTVLVYNNKAVVTNLPQLVANAQKDGWVKENTSWFYLKDGVKATGWVKDNGTWYYLNAEGVMQTGWVKDNGTWYYLNASGAMATGWVKDNGTWYYLNASGAMATGWYQVGGKWYYSYESGALAVSTTTPDGYTVNENGEWV